MKVTENSIQTGLYNKKKYWLRKPKSPKVAQAPSKIQSAFQIMSITRDQVSLPSCLPQFQLHFQFPYVDSLPVPATLYELQRKAEVV